MCNVDLDGKLTRCNEDLSSEKTTKKETEQKRDDLDAELAACHSSAKNLADEATQAKALLGGGGARALRGGRRPPRRSRETSGSTHSRNGVCATVPEIVCAARQENSVPCRPWDGLGRLRSPWACVNIHWLAVVPLVACSAMGIVPPPRKTCTTAQAAPSADTALAIVGAMAAAGGTAIASQRCPSDGCGASWQPAGAGLIVIGAAAAIGFGISAVHGFTSTARCSGIQPR